jgi:hypothetical protein
MDTLTENSANRNNSQSLTYRDSLRGPFQSPLTSEGGQSRFENMAGRVNPRYMTPTAASRAQVSTPEPRISTPPPSTSTGKRKAWMVSAAKRVGIVPGIPRSRKGGSTRGFHREKEQLLRYRKSLRIRYSSSSTMLGQFSDTSSSIQTTLLMPTQMCQHGLRWRAIPLKL